MKGLLEPWLARHEEEDLMDSNIWDQMKMEWARRSDARVVPERWGTDERLGGLTPAAMVELAHGSAVQCGTFRGVLCVPTMVCRCGRLVR